MSLLHELSMFVFVYFLALGGYSWALLGQGTACGPICSAGLGRPFPAQALSALALEIEDQQVAGRVIEEKSQVRNYKVILRKT